MSKQDLLRPSSIVSNEPFMYLTLYGHSALTFSDRNHACIAALAFVNPAMLFSRSRRIRISSHVRLSKIKKSRLRFPQTNGNQSDKARCRFCATIFSGNNSAGKLGAG